MSFKLWNWVSVIKLISPFPSLLTYTECTINVCLFLLQFFFFSLLPFEFNLICMKWKTLFSYFLCLQEVEHCSVGSGREFFYNAVYLASQISLLCAFFLLKIKKALIFHTQILNKFYLCYALKKARKFRWNESSYFCRCFGAMCEKLKWHFPWRRKKTNIEDVRCIGCVLLPTL